MFDKVKSMVLFMVLIITVSASGCVAVVSGAAGAGGGYIWANGVIIQEVDRTALEFYEATSAAVRDLGIIPTVDLHDRLSATIRGEFADGKDIWIDIVALTEQSARIKIRVGWFGDKLRSEMILNSIQTSL